MQLDFKMHETAKGVRRIFRSIYIVAKDALDKGKLPLASELTANLRAKNQWNALESAWFWLFAANLATYRSD